MSYSMEKNNVSRQGVTRVGPLAVLLVAGFAWHPEAQANTAAGTALTNSVTVNYTDAAGTAQAPVTDTVTVTVSLVGSVAWGTPSPDQATSSGAALPGAYTMTLRNAGNGSDTYTISDGTTDGANLTAGTWTFTTPVTLGATVSSGAGVFGGTNTDIPVSNLTVADFADGDTVVIGGATYLVVAAGTTATNLQVAGDATAVANGAGIQIGEQITYSYNGTAGTLTAGTASSTHTHNLTATGTDAFGNGAATDTTTNFVTTVNGALLTVTKLVRNTTDAVNGDAAGTTPTLLCGATYYGGGVTGDPGDVLEYIVKISNTASGTAKNVIFEDTFSSFTTLTAVNVDTNGDCAFDVVNASVALDEAGGIVESNDGTLATATAFKVYAGTGGDEQGVAGYNGTGGDIAAAGKAYVKYTLTIQ